MKAIEAINFGFTKAGIKALGSPLDGDSVAWGVELLRDLVDAWQADGLYVPFYLETVQIVTGSPITIGLAQTINIARPKFVRDTSFFCISGVDNPIHWISQQEYNEICVKDHSSQYPCYGYYDDSLPVSKLYFWPKPQNSELHLITDAQLPQFADTNITDYIIDTGYASAIKHELACMACEGIKEVPPDLRRRTDKAISKIRQNNATVPQLKMPYPLGHHGRGGWQRGLTE